MVGEAAVKLPKRKRYTVKDVINDLKKIGPTPRVLYDVGTELIYSEWSTCGNQYGHDHPVTMGFTQLLDFMQSGFEDQLVRGELWRAKDTQSSALNKAVKEMPSEFMNHIFSRPGDYIKGVLEAAIKWRKQEVKEYKKIEKGVRREIKADPDNADLWNNLRLLLWIIGKHKESSEAFKKAKALGWNATGSSLVGI
jgi:tetratricopeptide (TPR) repeat protein